MTTEVFVFLDRDGTLIKHIPYLYDPKQVELLPTVREGLAQLVEGGCRLFLHTNQSGVGRGYFSLAEARACNDRMIELLDLGSEVFEDICIATERPDEIPVYRKPSIRFAHETLVRFGGKAEQMYYIGDSLSDLMTAANAGGTGLGVQTGETQLRDVLAQTPHMGRTLVFNTFVQAAEHILLGRADA